MGELRENRKRRIRKRTIYAIILCVMLLCLFMIAFLLLFQIRSIKVEGNQYLSSQEVADWVESDEWSTNSIYAMIKYNLLDYELLPAMEGAKVTMKNPWTIKVDVTEKRVVGYIVFGDDCVYFDEDGMVLAITTEWWDDIPCIEGLAVNEVTVFKTLPISDENKKVFQHLLDISSTLKKYELTPDRIVCSGADLHLYFGNICAILGEDDFGNKIAQLPPILAKLGEQTGTLHLEHYGENTTTISFERDVLPDYAQEQTDQEQSDEAASAEDAGAEETPTDEEGAGEETSEGTEDVQSE